MEDILLQLEKNAVALRNMANAVLAGIQECREASNPLPGTKKVTRKTLERKMDLHTRILSGGRHKKPTSYTITNP